MKISSHLYRGFELETSSSIFFEHFLPAEFDLDSYRATSVDYFKQYGFKVSSLYKDVYALKNGIVSEKYISSDLYQCTIVPYLNKWDMFGAYADKNIYSWLFPDVLQPETVVKCQNGCLYDQNALSIDLAQAIRLIKETQRFVIKPTLSWISYLDANSKKGSGGGNGVNLFSTEKISDIELQNLLRSYGSDYIVQETVVQHSSMSRLNPTSLNTIRLYTYRRRSIANNEIVILGSLVRFGGKGAICDNACAGGGTCIVRNDGSVDDVIRRGLTLKTESLADRGIKDFVIPNWEQVKSVVTRLHKRLAFLDICGWDVGIGQNGEPIFVEVNSKPDCEFIQSSVGPMFGEYTDELMEKIKGVDVQYHLFVKKTFKDGRFYNYRLKSL